VLSGFVIFVLLYFSVITQGSQGSQSCPQREPGVFEHRLEFDGEARQYLLYVPESSDESPSPLVISLHGFAANMEQQMTITDWNSVAEEYGFIVAYPQGTGFPARWNGGEPPFGMTDDTDDVGFMQALIADIDSSNCVDHSRVYVNGLSNGGGMSHRLACEATDIFAAIGVVAGAHNEFEGGCNPTRPIPIIAFHGTADRTVPYEGGRSGGFDLPNIETWTQEWAERNQCSTTPDTIDTPDDVDYEGIRYNKCEDEVEVVLYTIEDGGHNWPDGKGQPEFFVGHVSEDMNASETMWAFFSQYALDN